MNIVKVSVKKNAERVFSEVGYRWHRRSGDYIRNEPYGHSKISFVILNYKPKYIVIPFFSFSSVEINKILDETLEVKPSLASDSIIFNLKHVGLAEEFEIDENEDFEMTIVEICDIVRSKIIPIFDQVKSDADLGRYIIDHNYDISNVFSVMNAISQHFVMMRADKVNAPDEKYFSQFLSNSHNMQCVERYLDIIQDTKNRSVLN